MNGYVSRAACRGRRPAQFAAYSGKERPALMAALLKDRSVARFIVAPDGYGKSSLAFEYAETMFSWQHTFWFSAQSPCFIRDIDEGGMADACLVCDKAMELVVFDDVPPLDPKRADLFSRAIDDFLERGCEVVVLCTPLADMFGRLQVDRLRVGAYDLLLNDEELDATRDAEEQQRIPARDLGPLARIPALAWGSGDVEESFAQSAFSEDMPYDMLAILASALVLGSGSVQDVLVLGGRVGVERLQEMFADYPHVDIDLEARRFATPFLDVGHLEASLKKRGSQLAEHAAVDSFAKVARLWIDVLVEQGNLERACDAVSALYPSRLWAAWLARNARYLVGSACFLQVARLCAGADAGDAATKSRVAALEALCLRLLGDERSALSRAARVAFDEAAPRDARICGLLLVTRVGSEQSVVRARRQLAEYAGLSESATGEDDPLWPVLARAWRACERGVSDLALLWDELRARGAHRDVLNVSASWLFSLVEGESAIGEPSIRALASCERFVRGQLSAASGDEVDYLVASAGLALEQAHMRGLTFADGPLGTPMLLELRRVEMHVYRQRQSYERDKRVQVQKGEDWSITHPDAALWRPGAHGVPKRTERIPVLELRVFGSFDASIGGVPIDRDQLNKRQVRTLLVLLATSRGRELSRDAIVNALWPESTDGARKSNFYTAWSRLRHVLMLPDGTCPYLIRHKYGCSLESRYIHSDVDRFDEICRDLLFGVPNYERWLALFAEVERDFSGELLPAERKNPLIAQMRNDYRNRLVDALVAAADSIALTDTPKWGIWFARAALQHDDTREDAYVALMRSQIASSQRTAAMMTFLKCRHVLSEKLGIDPSPEITMLYDDLLDAS